MRKQIAWGIVLIASLMVGTARADDSLNKELLKAAYAGERLSVEALITRGADVNVKDKDGWTPLHFAAFEPYGNKDVAELLIARGADWNAKDNRGWTPLHFAANQPSGGNRDVAVLLIAKGADVNAKDNHGRTPLHDAAGHSFGGNRDLLNLLITKGADVNARDNDGSTPLHDAASKPRYVAELLIAKGAKVNAKDNAGSTPLHSAVWNGEKDVAELLIVKGADVNAKDNHGQTPLHYVGRNPYGNVDMTELLIAKGADWNAKDSEGSTPLYYVADHGGKKEVVALLIAKGADVNTKYNEGGTPLGAAKLAESVKHSKDNEEIIAMLQSAIAKNMGRQSGKDVPKLLAEFKGHSDKEILRAAIIDLALEQRPAIPPRAEAAAGRGAYMFKNAKSPDDTLSAAKEYLTAIETAPWVANYYYNLCTVLEKTPYTQQALHACKLYLVAAPNAPDAGDMQQRIAGLQYASDRDKAQVKQRTLYTTYVGRKQLYRFGGISGEVSGKDIVLKLNVDWDAAPPKYQVYVGCYGTDHTTGDTHDLVTTDSAIYICNPSVQLRLIIKPEGEGFVAVSSSSGGSVRATLAELFKAKQETMSQAVMFSASGVQGEQFYVPYAQGGLHHVGFFMYESDCHGSILKKDPRALPDGFITAEKSNSSERFHSQQDVDLCTSQFASKTGYHFGETE